MNRSLTFIHLSDIHFNKYSGDSYDLDLDLRNEIINDIKQVNCFVEKPTAILVCGDIAYSGAEIEYENAIDFLKTICKSVHIEDTSVFCVPGNHDVDQSVSRNSQTIMGIQSQIESAEDINGIIASFSRDEYAKPLLYEHIHKYNTFAAKFLCHINHENPNASQEYDLDDKTKLKLWGLNSILISNHLDNQHKNRLMILGEYQIPPNDGAIYLSLCHHPPELWKNGGYLQKRINERIQIQLYGHKHISDISQQDNCLLIGSGATHPSRREKEWRPRYNWFTIYTDDKNGKRILKIKIYPRILDEKDDHFVTDYCITNGKAFSEYAINLDKILDKNKIISNNNTPETLVFQNYMNNQIDKNRAIRILVYRFLSLSFISRTMILTKYNLVDEDDEGIEHNNLLEKILKKADEQKKLAELWNEVNYRITDGKYTTNPFNDINEVNKWK